MDKLLRTFLLLWIFVITATCNASQVFAFYNHYEPTHDSIKHHKNPEWFEDAKFGIMIHYGLYSVPGWAPLFNPTNKIFSKEFFINNPYAEWYFNTMQIVGSPTYKHHQAVYGTHFTYDDFVPLFKKSLTKWNPDSWAQLFATANAKYVVFVAKHHDGFLLWPSDRQNPKKRNFYSERDIVGELTQAVRAHGMRMGIYYNGDDWAWQTQAKLPVTNTKQLIMNMPQSQAYADYVDFHWRELIRKYKPDLLWNDFALTQKINKFKLFADYYNQIPWGIVDNRWGQNQINFSLFGQPSDKVIDFQRSYDWFDYYTPEYLPKYRLTQHRWEADHGPGYSFGYNQEEYLHPEHLKSLDQMIEDLVDIVSKNGNLLLAISPMADGSIPPYQENLLRGIGAWLDINDEAIYSTRPWRVATGSTTFAKDSVRFTCSKNYENLYVILLKKPTGEKVTIKNLPVTNVKSSIQLLNGKRNIPISWSSTENDLSLILPQDVSTDHALAFKITPKPR